MDNKAIAKSLVRLAKAIIAKSGSYLDIGKKPKEGDKVWIIIVGMTEKLIHGIITRVSNIDNRGLANTYAEVSVDENSSYHVAINQMYDHKPKKVKKTDEYGEVTVWE